jgi:hypothetical protein
MFVFLHFGPIPLRNWPKIRLIKERKERKMSSGRLLPSYYDIFRLLCLIYVIMVAGDKGL